MKRYTIGVMGGVVLALTLLLLRSCISGSAPVTADAFSPAPPAVDSGSVSMLSNVVSGSTAVDLKYQVQTGVGNEIEYHSYWGFGGGGSDEDPFIQEVRKRTSRLSYVYNSQLKGRLWSAVEHEGRKVIALYFDLDGDGKLANNERILPTRKVDDHSIEFITPDFSLKSEDGGASLFRVLLRVSFYGRNIEPNFMWSPACVLVGTATLEGQSTQIMLFANGFGGAFDAFGSSSCGWIMGEPQPETQSYIPRELLSKLIRCGGQFYQLKFEGRSGLGHAARAVLTRDLSPTGAFAMKCAGTNAVELETKNIYLQGAKDRAICFRLENTAIQIPVGDYRLQRGYLKYRNKDQEEWGVSFSEGPEVNLRAEQKVEVLLGEPVLTVRAIREQERYVAEAKPVTVIQRGTRLYLEPRIVGKGGEVLTRFEQSPGKASQATLFPPSIRITGPDGQEVLSQKMEYG
ncbi:MAG TPA: hypothetical protein P5186_29675 [Candidatus Paceibacterota bacterium]|nr:hypothetical protein [Candidatus Paceibacterota bacterium]